MTAEHEQMVDVFKEHISDACETGARHECYLLCAQLITFAKEVKDEGGMTKKEYREILDSCADAYNLFSI